MTRVSPRILPESYYLGLGPTLVKWYGICSYKWNCPDLSKKFTHLSHDDLELGPSHGLEKSVRVYTSDMSYKYLRLYNLSASLTSFACGDFLGAVSTCSLLRSSLGKLLSSVTSRTTLQFKKSLLYFYCHIESISYQVNQLIHLPHDFFAEFCFNLFECRFCVFDGVV